MSYQIAKFEENPCVGTDESTPLFDFTESCTDSESFVRGGPILISFYLFNFLVDKGREDPNITKSWPSPAPSETPFKWCFAGGPMVAQL